MAAVPGMAGWIESFDVQRNGDVVLTVTVPSEGIHEHILVKRTELDTIYAASAAKHPRRT